jgi:hypothetical protein
MPKRLVGNKESPKHNMVVCSHFLLEFISGGRNGAYRMAQWCIQDGVDWNDASIRS